MQKPIYLPVFGRKGISFPLIFTGKGLTLHFPGGARLSGNIKDYKKIWILLIKHLINLVIPGALSIIYSFNSLKITFTSNHIKSFMSI